MGQVVDVFFEVSRDLLLGLAQRSELAAVAVLPLQGLLKVGVVVVLLQQILKVLPHVGIDAGIRALAPVEASPRGRAYVALLLCLLLGSVRGRLAAVLIAIADEEMALVLSELALTLQLLVDLVPLLDVGLNVVLRRGAELCLLGLRLQDVEEVDHVNELLQVPHLLVIGLGCLLSLEDFGLLPRRVPLGLAL